MTDLKLFSINVRQEWSTDADVLCLAHSENDANKACRRLVKLEPWDDFFSEKEVMSQELPLSFLSTYKHKPDVHLIALDEMGTFDYYEYDDFKSSISDEKLEELRILALEKNNGQLHFEIN